MTSPVRTRAPRPEPVRTTPVRPGSGRPQQRRTPQVAPPRRPDLRVVRDARPRRGTGLMLCAVGAVMFASLLASALFHSVLVTGQDELDRMDRSILTERADLQRSRLALADAQSPERIAAEARKLGMVPAEQQTWITPEGGADPVVTRSPGAEAEDPDAVDADDPDTSGTTDADQPDSDQTDDGSTTPTVNGAAR